MCSTPRRHATPHGVRRSPAAGRHAEYAAMVARSNASVEQGRRERDRARGQLTRPHTHSVRIERVACPLHVLQLKNGLRRVGPGETLEVEIGQTAALNDLLAASHALGHATEVTGSGPDTRLYVTRAG